MRRLIEISIPVYMKEKNRDLRDLSPNCNAGGETFLTGNVLYCSETPLIQIKLKVIFFLTWKKKVDGLRPHLITCCSICYFGILYQRLVLNYCKFQHLTNI